MLVTFSKRKSNLLKKANVLCTLCGVECAIVVFSPAGKVFSFGHPSVDQVTDRYLNGILNPTPSPPPPNQVPQNPSEGQHQAGTDIVQTLSAELSKLTSPLEASKKHGQALDERRAARMATNWWERPVADINNAAQLDALRDAMLNLRGKVYTQAGLRIQASASSSSVPAAPFAGYNSNPDFTGAGPSTGLLSGGFLGGNYNFGPNEDSPCG
uniref:MADS-box domain-containing protein n=1 Tax=Kalanchoe fedtschenkoi TaxID=63787 RepID=A0A7N0ZTT1_KALFE